MNYSKSEENRNTMKTPPTWGQAVSHSGQRVIASYLRSSTGFQIVGNVHYMPFTGMFNIIISNQDEHAAFLKFAHENILRITSCVQTGLPVFELNL